MINHSVAILSSTGHTMDPHQLTLSEQNFLFLSNNTIKFFRLPIQIPQDHSAARPDLKQVLSWIVQALTDAQLHSTKN